MAQAVLPDSQVFVLEGYTMTNTPMSDLDPKVKELLEAARHVVDTGERNGLYRLGDAIAAFGPPKPEPVPVIPAWEEFVKDKPVQQWGIGQAPVAVMVGRVAIHRDHFDVIREALSKSKAPTE